MVPMHDERSEDGAAVRARLTVFQGVHPIPCHVAAHALALETRSFPALGVVPAVVGAPAVATVGELAGPGPMEATSWFRPTAHRTRSDCHVRRARHRLSIRLHDPS